MLKYTVWRGRTELNFNFVAEDFAEVHLIHPLSFAAGLSFWCCLQGALRTHSPLKLVGLVTDIWKTPLKLHMLGSSTVR